MSMNLWHKLSRFLHRHKWATCDSAWDSLILPFPLLLSTHIRIVNPLPVNCWGGPGQRPLPLRRLLDCVGTLALSVPCPGTMPHNPFIIPLNTRPLSASHILFLISKAGEGLRSCPSESCRPRNLSTKVLKELLLRLHSPISEWITDDNSKHTTCSCLWLLPPPLLEKDPSYRKQWSGRRWWSKAAVMRSWVRERNG